MTTALVLGGGAPNLTLMSGALAALDEEGVEFDVISSLGAGMLVGLLYAAPKGMTRRQALKRTTDLGVADCIYNLLPVNYKVFHKPGSAAQLYRSWVRFFRGGMPSCGEPSLDQFWEDLCQLTLSTFCPTSLNPWSPGLCQPAPWIEDLVDFEKLRKKDRDEKDRDSFGGEFFVSAYCVNDHKMRMFPRERITPDVFRACLAMPFIYPPSRLDGKSYIEGSAYDTYNFRDLFTDQEVRDRLDAKKIVPNLLVVCDVLGRKEMLRPPHNLFDAWVMSIMTPLVAMARDDLKIFCLEHARRYKGTTLLPLTFDINPGRWRKVLDWSRENLEALYDIGRKAGQDFYRRYNAELHSGRRVNGRRYSARDEILKRDEKPEVAGLKRRSDRAVTSTVPRGVRAAGKRPDEAARP